MWRFLRVGALIVITVSNHSFSQEKKYDDCVVFDQFTNEIIQGVTFTNDKGIAIAKTNSSGVVRLYRSSKYSWLELTCVGYQNKRINLDTVLNHRIAMNQISERLSEVVVLQNINPNVFDKRVITGAATVYDLKKIADQTVIDVGQMLRGKITGLSIEGNGELGGEYKVRIRGNNSFFSTNIANEPLYVLDGRIISAEIFKTLNPFDIESITVLKDAVATALYGVKSANGAIEIQSKRGNKSKLEVNYVFNQGITQRAKLGVSLMDSKEKLLFEYISKNQELPGYRYSETYIRARYARDSNLDFLVQQGRNTLDSLSRINTNWRDVLLRASYYRSHNLSFSGGNTNSQFYLSLGYAAQGGQAKGNSRDRYSMRFNFDHQLSKHFEVSFSTEAALGVVKNDVSAAQIDSRNGGDIYSLLFKLNPYETIRDSSGKFTSLVSFHGKTFQDIQSAYLASNLNKKFGGGVSFRANILSGLSWNTSLGIDYEDIVSEKRIAPEDYSQQSFSEGKGMFARNITSNTAINFNSRVLYTKEVYKNHKLLFSANMDYQRDKSDLIGYTGFGLLPDIYTAAAINQSLTGSRAPKLGYGLVEAAILGMGAAFNYTYKDNLDVYFSLKKDGTSRLPRDKAWSSNWSVGAAYLLFKGEQLKTFNYRFSYGRTSGLFGVSYTLATPVFAFNDTLRYGQTNALSLLDLYNHDLRPERVSTINTGVDLRFKWANLRVGVDVYQKMTKDALLEVPIPLSTGYASMLRNAGVLINKGVEVSVSSGVTISNIGFDFGGQLSYNQNKIIDLYYTRKIYSSGDAPVPLYEVGKSTGLVYGFRSLGIHPLDGIERYLGADGTELKSTDKISEKDYVVLGKADFPITGGCNVSFSYKRITFYADFVGAFGAVKKYATSYIRDNLDARYVAESGVVDQIWQQGGDQGKTFQSLFLGGSSSYYYNWTIPNTRTSGKASFVKLNNVRLGYNLRLRKPHIDKYFSTINIYCQVQNMKSWSNFIGADPETGTLRGALLPVYSFGVNIKL